MNPRLLLTLGLLASLLLAALITGMFWTGDTSQRPATDAGVTQRAEDPLPPEAGGARMPTAVVHDQDTSERMTRYNELKARLVSASTARQAREKPSAPASEIAEAAPMPVGSLPREYIAKQMQEIVPLVKECYDMALELEPELAGKVVVRWTIIGEPEIGGLVESSEVVPDVSDITSPDFLQCVQESIYAIELEAPAGGGTVTVNYPLVFANGD